MNMENTENMLEFLQEMEDGGLDLDLALQDYGHLLEDTDVDQAYRDYMDARAAIKKTLKRVARENDLNDVDLD